MTLAIPNDLYDIMKAHKEIKWSEIAFKAMIGHAIKLKSLDEITKKSEFTENDAMQMDIKIKKSLRKHYEKEVS